MNLGDKIEQDCFEAPLGIWQGSLAYADMMDTKAPLGQDQPQTQGHHVIQSLPPVGGRAPGRLTPSASRWHTAAFGG